MKVERFGVSVDGDMISGEVHRMPLPGVVVLSHGLTNNRHDAPLFAEMRERVQGEGMSVCLFDYRGSGESTGCFEDKTISGGISDLRQVVAYLEQQRLGPIYIFGRSVGGTVGGFLARDSRVAATVLASPPYDLAATFMPTWTEPEEGFVNLPARYKPSGQLKGAYRLSERFYAELGMLTQRLQTAMAGADNVLLIHGDADEKQPLSQSMEAFQRLGDRRSLIIHHSVGHNYIGAEHLVAAEAVAWFRGGNQ
jgi:uncharacterized protein